MINPIKLRTKKKYEKLDELYNRNSTRRRVCVDGHKIMMLLQLQETCTQQQLLISSQDVCYYNDVSVNSCLIKSHAVLHDIVVNCCIYGLFSTETHIYACFLVFVLSLATLLAFSTTSEGQDFVSTI